MLLTHQEFLEECALLSELKLPSQAFHVVLEAVGLDAQKAMSSNRGLRVKRFFDVFLLPNQSKLQLVLKENMLQLGFYLRGDDESGMYSIPFGACLQKCHWNTQPFSMPKSVAIACKFKILPSSTNQGINNSSRESHHGIREDDEDYDNFSGDGDIGSGDGVSHEKDSYVEVSLDEEQAQSVFRSLWSTFRLLLCKGHYVDLCIGPFKFAGANGGVSQVCSLDVLRADKPEIATVSASRIGIHRDDSAFLPVQRQSGVGVSDDDAGDMSMGEARAITQRILQQTMMHDDPQQIFLIMDADNSGSISWTEWWRAVEGVVRQHCKPDLDVLLESYVEKSFAYWSHHLHQIFERHGETVSVPPVGADLEISLQVLFGSVKSDPVFGFILPLLAEFQTASNVRGVVTWTSFWRVVEGAIKEAVKTDVEYRMRQEIGNTFLEVKLSFMKIFEAMDTDSNGTISLEEFTDLLSNRRLDVLAAITAPVSATPTAKMGRSQSTESSSPLLLKGVKSPSSSPEPAAAQKALARTLSRSASVRSRTPSMVVTDNSQDLRSTNVGAWGAPLGSGGIGTTDAKSMRNGSRVHPSSPMFLTASASFNTAITRGQR